MGLTRWYRSIIGIVFATSILVVSCASDDTPVAMPFDHAYTDYARLLSEYVSEAGWVDYDGLTADSAGLRAVVTAVQSLSSDTLEAFSETEALAFWINAYNAVTLLSIVEAYPVASIKDIDGVWDRRKWPIAGQRLTLNNIEHNILRRDFSEPRIHFAINCASVGCPPLLNEPYRPATLESQLGESARRFLLNPLRNRFYPDEQRAELSEVFDWFGADFGRRYTTDEPSDQAEGLRPALNFIADVLPDSIAGFVGREGATVTFKTYDWDLNSTKADAAQPDEHLE